MLAENRCALKIVLRVRVEIFAALSYVKADGC